MINSDGVYAYFDNRFGPLTPSTNGWYLGECPYCGGPQWKNSFMVNPEYNSAKCWRGCYKGSATGLVMSIEGITYFEARQLIDGMEVPVLTQRHISKTASKKYSGLPFGYVPILYTGDEVLGARAQRYLEGRGFDLNFLDQIGVGFCNQNCDDPTEDYFGFIIIPLYRDGKLKYFTARNFLSNFPRYKNPSKDAYSTGKSEILFNEQALYHHSKIYLLEGWADAATIGSSGVSFQGLTLGPWQRSKIISSPVEEVVIISDVGFYHSSLKNALGLINDKKVKVISIDEFSDLGKDVNEIGLKSIMEKEKVVPYLNKFKLFKLLKNAA